jgi:hypothetical protein
LIPFSPAPVYLTQILTILGKVAFIWKIAAGNHTKMKQLTVVEIDGNWNHRRNGSTHILDMVAVENRCIVDFDIVQKQMD